MSATTEKLSHATGIDEGAVAHGRSIKSVYVYEAPVRVWHWINALAITVLALTGYFIGSPLPTPPGEASANYLMGYIRFAHFAAGYVLAIGFAGRIYWALVGNEHARQIFMPPLFKLAWWSEVMFELRWYFFLEDRPKKYVGHNPLAAVMMFFLFVLGTLFMIITGFALYSEGAGHGHWSGVMFGWVLWLIGGRQTAVSYTHLTLPCTACTGSACGCCSVSSSSMCTPRCARTS